MNNRKNLMLAVSIIASVFSFAADAAMIDLTGQGGNGGGFGNSLNFNQNGISLTVSAYGETGAEHPPGSLYYLFETAEVYSWNSGLGICNRHEGSAAGGCSTNEHEVDTVNRDDLLVFEFDQSVNFESITVDPFNGSGSDPNDRDIIYWVGQVSQPLHLTNETFATLSSITGIEDEIYSPVSSSYSPFTHSLTGTGNILLLSGNYYDLGCKNKNTSSGSECEAYKITNITVSAAPPPIPVPAAFWLFASGVSTLFWRQRKVAV